LVRAVIEQWSASALTQTAQGRPVLRHQPAKSLRFRRSGNACTISALNLLNVSEHKLLNTSLRPKRNLYFKNKAKERDMLAAKMTPAQIAEAQRMASEWKPSGLSP
jgi:hypothetical protein